MGLRALAREPQPVAWSGPAPRAEQALHVAWHPKSALVIALAGRPNNAGLAPLAEDLASVVFELPEREILDLPLTSEQRAIYAGVYYMGCTRTTIEAREEGLFFQSPYDGPYRLRYQGEHRFISADDDEVRLRIHGRQRRRAGSSFCSNTAHARAPCASSDAPRRGVRRASTRVLICSSRLCGGVSRRTVASARPLQRLHAMRIPGLTVLLGLPLLAFAAQSPQKTSPRRAASPMSRVRISSATPRGISTGCGRSTTSAACGAIRPPRRSVRRRAR